MHGLPSPMAERLLAIRQEELLRSRRHRRHDRLAAPLRVRVPNRVPRRWRRRYL